MDANTQNWQLATIHPPQNANKISQYSSFIRNQNFIPVAAVIQLSQALLDNFGTMFFRCVAATSLPSAPEDRVHRAELLLNPAPWWLVILPEGWRCFCEMFTRRVALLHLLSPPFFLSSIYEAKNVWVMTPEGILVRWITKALKVDLYESKFSTGIRHSAQRSLQEQQI